MSQFNPDIYAVGPEGTGIARSTMAMYEKRARLALQANGYTPGESSDTNFSPSSTTGEVTSTNYTGTATYSVVPYALTHVNSNGLTVSETRNWTHKIRPNTLVMMKAAKAPTTMSGTSSPPVILTVPQLNYQLHHEMRERFSHLYAAFVPLNAVAEANPNPAARAVAIAAVRRDLQNGMVDAWRAVMNMALQWAPAGVMQTSNDRLPVSHANTQIETKVVQTCGVAFVQNLWGGGVCCGSTLWLRIGTVMHNAREAKVYNLNGSESCTVQAIETQFHYRLPRVEAVISNVGHTIGIDNSMLRLTDSLVEAPRNGFQADDYFVLTEVFKVGVCFDMSGMPRGARSSGKDDVKTFEVSSFEPPGTSNQIQILLNGEM